MKYAFFIIGLVIASCGAETSAPACPNYTVDVTDEAAYIRVLSDEPRVMYCVYWPDYDQELCTWIDRDYYDCIRIRRETFRTRITIDGCEIWLW